MTTVLCLDDFTKALSQVILTMVANDYRVLSAADSATAVALAGDVPIDAVILNCQSLSNNFALVTALRSLQPKIAVVMFSGYCGVPCPLLRLADACVQKGETQSAFLATLRAVLCQRNYGLCRSIAS